MPTSIRLDPRAERLLRQLARQRRQTKSEVIRAAIDAMAAIIEGLKGRLGENESTLIDALGQLRMAYVQLHGAASETGA